MSQLRYIQRDLDGKVVGHYAHPHPYATEEAAPNHPDIVAWQAKRDADKAAHIARRAEMSPDKLLARIAALEKILGK